MAHEDVGVGGTSWYSVLVDERGTLFQQAYTTRPVLLPTWLTPIKDQLRVAVDGVAYAFDDGNDPNRTNTWTFTQSPPPAQGVMASGIRVTFDSNGITQSAQFGIRDGNGEWYTDLQDNEDITFSIAGDTTGLEERLFDLDGNTVYTADNSVSNVLTISFQVPRAVSAFGWAGDNAPSSTSIEDMSVEVNLGSVAMLLTDPDYVFVEARTGIVFTEYTDPDNYDPDIDLLFIEIPSSLQSDGDLAANPVVTVTPALTVDNRITIWRETRQDRPHNPPINGSLVDVNNLHFYFTQRLFIMQDICEYKDLTNFLDFPQYDQEDRRDLTIGDQLQIFLNHSTATVYSFSTIALLEGIPGVTNKGNQIIVEQGDLSDGTSTFWTLVDAGDYTVDSTLVRITLDTTSTLDLRIRRKTRLDALHFDLRDKQPAWNTRALVLVATQIRFLVEESCYVPRFFQGSILHNTIFPREWNWLNYTGTSLFQIFGGPFWTGNGEIQVWDNDLELDDPADYTVEYPTIRYTGPITSPHVGSTGNFWGDFVGSGGGGSSTAPWEPGSMPPFPGDLAPIDPLDGVFSDGINLSISISFIDGTTVLNGPIPGFPSGLSMAGDGTNTGSFGDSNMYLAIDLIVRSTFAGQSTVNRRTVAYCAGLCNGATIFGFRAIGKAQDNNGDGTFEGFYEASGALGCSDGAGGISEISGMWADHVAARGGYSDNELITANERAMLQLMNANDNHRDIARLNGESSMIGMNNVSESDIAAGGLGGTLPGDMQGIMGP